MSSATIARPAASEFASYYQGYVKEVPDGDVIAHLERQIAETVTLLRHIDESRSRHRYAPGKWSIREVVGHLSDTERVFCYRALTFARADETSLPAFDENAWAAHSNADERPLAEHVAELQAVRSATVAMLRGFGNAEFTRMGKANNNPFTVRAIAYIIAGHERHHVKILKERYGV